MLKYICGLIIVMATLPLSADDYDLTPFLQLTPIEANADNVFELPNLTPIATKEVDVSAIPASVVTVNTASVKTAKANTTTYSGRSRGRFFRNLANLCR
jgi:hypothetical protein